MKKIALIFVISFIFANIALAHEAGQSLESKVGEYLVDIGYDSVTENPISGQATLFNFGLFKNGNPAEFTDIYVDINKTNEPSIFYADLNSVKGSPKTLIFTFPSDGEYKMRVRYRKDSQVLAQANFSLAVVGDKTESAKKEIAIKAETKKTDKFIYIFSGALSAAIIFGLAKFLKK